MYESTDGPRSNFGWSPPERERYIKEQLTGSSSHTHLVPFRGEELWLKVVTVPAELPKYRLRNGRTAALQEEYVATNDLPDNYFRLDDELLEVQEAQHCLLKKLIEAQDLLSYFQNPANRQTEPLILTSSGFVMNGNRRLCTYRELYWSDPAAYAHLGSVRAVVLPPADEKAIDRLEAQLQLRPEMRADYTWYARAQMMQDRQEYHKLTTEELAAFYDEKPSDLETLLQAHRLASRYLESRGRANRWSSLGSSDHEYAFARMVSFGKKISAADDLRLFHEAAFLLVDDPKGGRLYQSVADLQKYLEPVKEQLVVGLSIEPGDGGADRGTEVVVHDADDPLAPEAPTGDISSDDVARAIATPERANEARGLIKAAIDAENEAAKEEKNANYARSRLTRAHSLVAEAANHGLRPDANLIGVLQQVERIRHHLEVISEYVRQRTSS